jgi:Cu2+-exporting ATPase
MSLNVTRVADGRIQIRCRELLDEPDGRLCREFLQRVLSADGVTGVALIQGRGRAPENTVEIRYAHRRVALADVMRSIATAVRGKQAPAAPPSNGHLNGHGHGPLNGFVTVYPNGHSNGHLNGHGNGHISALPTNGSARTGSGSLHSSGGHAHRADESAVPGNALESVPAVPDARGVCRFYRQGQVFTSWEVIYETPNRLRVRHPILRRRSEVCQAIERELMGVLGVDTYSTSSATGTVLIKYNPKKLRRDQVLTILDSALANATIPEKKDPIDLDLPLNTLNVPLAVAGTFAAPALLPAAAGLLVYNSLHTYKAAYNVVARERRLGVDVLDAIVVTSCLATGTIFAGAVLTWCLSFGRLLVKKTQDRSKKLLLSAFGKQPRFVWLLKNGQEIETPLEKLQANDIIVVGTGDTVPVDGVIHEGIATLDQHALTGESTPAEKGPGDRVFASTLMVAGRIQVRVEQAGAETASAKIARILNETAGYKLGAQHRGERMADRAVIPTLALGATALSTIGPGGAVAVLNSDFGTGIRMAAPLGMLSSLALAANRGILVKDGRALEKMAEIDTVLFDKTGTLTREIPEVGRIITSNGYDENKILQWAAAAENRFSHPIARAIVQEFEKTNLPMLPIEDTKYKMGYGISAEIEGRHIRVGSARYMALEGVAIPPHVQEALDKAHQEGHTLVFVAVDDHLGGALELQASQRPEVAEIIAGLRARGIKHIAIISGDHEAPTRKLATRLGMDEYFAGVLPADKASYVERLQAQGRKVCFVGDGINDSIALKKADVSISLRGATSIATDTAQVVFMEESLGKLCQFRDIAQSLESNVKRSWTLILVPNAACIAGAFTLGFGVMASVLTNNVAAIAALANGMAPLRQLRREQEAAENEEARALAQHETDTVAAPNFILHPQPALAGTAHPR